MRFSMFKTATVLERCRVGFLEQPRRTLTDRVDSMVGNRKRLGWSGDRVYETIGRRFYFRITCLSDPHPVFG